jgi:hypothetical protein
MGSLFEASKVTGVPKTTLALQNRKPKTDLLEALTYKVLLTLLQERKQYDTSLKS